MGGHYGSIHVRTDDSDTVLSAVYAVAREQKLRFLVAPAINGWVSVFPEHNGQNAKVSEDLTTRLGEIELLHCLVHDDDVFAYWYFQNGTLRDSYNSCPDYFGEKNPEPRGGNAQALAHLLSDARKISQLQSLLDAARFDFEMERFDRFARLLGLPNAVTAYEYLQGGERDGIKHWRKFVHVPDLSAQKAEARVRELRARAEMKRLTREGVLLLDLVGEKESRHSFASAPVWCVDPMTSDVLFAWRTGRDLTPLTRLALRDKQQSAVGCDIADYYFNLALDASGRWLGVGGASVQVWDLREKRLHLTQPQPRAANAICFSPDGKFLFSGSEKQITVASLEAAADAQTIQLQGHCEKIAAHPDGNLLAVVDNFGILLVIDLRALRVINQVWIKEKPTLPEDIRGSVMAQAAENFASVLEGHLSREELEQYRKDTLRGFLPKESITAVSFSPDGKWVFCGTVAGMHVLAWDEVMRCVEMKPVTPHYSVEAEEMQTEHQEDWSKGQRRIYAVTFDNVHQRILFSGLEGKVRFLEMADGRSGDLLVPPAPVPLIELGLTPDRSAIVCTARRIEFKSDKQWPLRLQVWNYPALCQRAGIPS